MKTKMNLQEFTTRINLLTVKQQLMINPQIYYNPDHIHYYNELNKGNYEFCIDYLNENISLLNKNKITNKNMNRNERRTEMNEINRKVLEMQRNDEPLTKDEQKYIIENSKHLFGFQIDADQLYSGKEFYNESNIELINKIKYHMSIMMIELGVATKNNNDKLIVNDEELIITNAIGGYCQLLNGYSYYNWKNMNIIRDIYRTITNIIDEHKMKMENKYEDMHKSDEELLEEDKEYRESVCPNYDLDFGNGASFIEDEDEEDIIKPSMITDIPKSVEEMLKNSDK